MPDRTAWLATAHDTLSIELTALRQLAEQLDPGPFGDAVELILSGHGHHLVCTGVGKSGHIAHKIAATFSSTGTPAVFLSAAEGVHGDLGVAQPGDVVLAFSYRGESEEIRALLPALVRIGCPIIAFTGRPESTLARNSRVVLDVAVEREACPHNLAPTASTTVMLALGDALAMAVMRARDFTAEDFARFHPGGSLGRRLLLTVGDVIRTGDEPHSVRADQSVQEALLVMTAAAIRGVVNVVDEAGLLVGIFTDGDLRRRLEAEGAAVLTRPMREVMSAHPTRITPDRLATEGLAVMQAREFDNISVVDHAGRAVGVLDVQDLLRAGLV